MITSAESDMLSAAQTLSSALSGYPGLRESADAVITFFRDVVQGKRVLISDDRGIIIYDSFKASSFLGKLLVSPELMSALEGYDTPSCTYTAEVFENRAAAPVVREGVIVGAVYLLQTDTDNPTLLESIRLDMIRITVISLLLFVSGVMVFNVALGRRFDRLMRGIEAVGGGDYDHRIDMGGSDELSDIATRFNELSVKLKTTEEARRRFVSDASHELKTPLASIKLLSDSIEQNANVSEGDMREFVHDIGDEIQRLIRISESLLSLTRLDSVPEPELIACELGRQIRKSAELLRGSCEHYMVTLVLDIDGEYFALGTNDGIFHITFNLLENAIKYNRPGGEVRVSLSLDGEHVIMAVADNGIGIPDDELNMIFDRFYRVDKTRSRETGGTGLGLSIVSEWAGKLNGVVEVESRLGKGTVFRIRLPRARGVEQ